MGKALRLLTASVIASFAIIGLGTFVVIVLNLTTTPEVNMVCPT